MSWFDYSQSVLQKVSFDKALFRKELRKLLGYLSVVERIQLLRWCRQQRPWKRAEPVLVPDEKKQPTTNGQLHADRWPWPNENKKANTTCSPESYEMVVHPSTKD